MNHLTRVPNGTETLPGSYNVTFDQYLGVLRQFFVPTLRFQYASVMNSHRRTMYKNKPGVVLMWNKNNFSKIYVTDHQRVPLDKRNPQHWMTVFYWNDAQELRRINRTIGVPRYDLPKPLPYNVPSRGSRVDAGSLCRRGQARKDTRNSRPFKNWRARSSGFGQR